MSLMVFLSLTAVARSFLSAFCSTRYSWCCSSLISAFSGSFRSCSRSSAHFFSSLNFEKIAAPIRENFSVPVIFSRMLAFSSWLASMNLANSPCARSVVRQKSLNSRPMIGAEAMNLSHSAVLVRLTLPSAEVMLRFGVDRRVVSFFPLPRETLHEAVYSLPSLPSKTRVAPALVVPRRTNWRASLRDTTPFSEQLNSLSV